MLKNFKTYTRLRELIDVHGSLCVDESFSWANDYQLPAMSLDLPMINKRAKISSVVLHKNPIFIQLEDGTRLFFTYEEYKRIRGTPEVGKTMSISMIRLSDDYSSAPSKIQSCDVI